MATAKKLPSGNYRVQVFAGYDEAGKRVYKSFTHKKKAMAELEAAQFIALKNRMKDPEHWTLGEAMDKYIESKSDILSPATIRGYNTIRNNSLIPIINMQIGKINSKIIQEAINHEAKSKTPKTVRNIHGLLTTVLKTYNPNLSFETSLPQKVKPDLYIPNDVEVLNVLSKAKGTVMELPIMLAAYLGLRRSEICALTVDDFNRNTKAVSITKAIVQDSDQSWTQKAPKSYAGYRTIATPESILSLLPEQGNITNLTPNAMSKRFVVLTNGKYTFHALRHYNASIMLLQNVPNKYAMERMGHSSDYMLKNVYQHLFEDKQREIAVNLNNYFDKLMQHEMSHDDG